MMPNQLFKCLSDDTRLNILLLLLDTQELCVCELTQALEISQPKVSRHLANLRECALLIDRRDKQWIYYRINPELPEWALTILQKSREPNQTYTNAALDRIESFQCNT